MLEIKQYRYIRYDDGEVTEEYTCTPSEYSKIGEMIRAGLGELTTHIFEEYKDGTRKEIMLADETLYKYISKENDVFCLKEIK